MLCTLIPVFFLLLKSINYYYLFIYLKKNSYTHSARHVVILHWIYDRCTPLKSICELHIKIFLPHKRIIAFSLNRITSCRFIYSIFVIQNTLFLQLCINCLKPASKKRRKKNYSMKQPFSKVIDNK